MDVCLYFGRMCVFRHQVSGLKKHSDRGMVFQRLRSSLQVAREADTKEVYPPPLPDTRVLVDDEVRNREAAV